MDKGVVNVCSLSKMKVVPKDNNYFFLTTRGTRKIEGVRQLSELAPSPSLFKKYTNEWKGTPPELWWDKYQEQYLKELSDVSINKVIDGLNRGLNATLMCFCGDESCCHRSLLKMKFKELGYEVKSY